MNHRWLGLLLIGLTINFGAAEPNDSSAVKPMLDSLDRATVDSAMKLLNLRPDELGFDKLWVADDTFRLAVVEEMLNQPLRFPDYMDQTAAMIDSNALKPANLLDFIAQQLVVEPMDGRPPLPDFRIPDFTPTAPFEIWIAAINEAEPYRRRFYANLDSTELLDLMMAAPTLWSEAPDSVKKLLFGKWQFERGLMPDTSRVVDSDRVLDIMKKLDRDALHIAARLVVPAAQALARGTAEANWDGLTAKETIQGVSGEVLFFDETNWGRMVVGGEGTNIYDGEWSLIIDLGGDDIYRDRAGGAMGELGLPFSAVIDLAGDDIYDAKGRDVAQGAGFLGIGILVDRMGDDIYSAGNYSQGAGYFGVGFAVDHNGADDRRGGYFMQGAGHCGVGVLIDNGDEGSDDRYISSCWAQGFASTFGYGLLFDDGGDDSYKAGGAFFHEPLLPHDYRSFAGGFGMGWRPRAGGGIGVLYDKGDGNDFFNAEVMALGASYWYSIGMLIDGGGNDHYSLAHYGLGVGIHLSVGGLYDRDGDDQYRSRLGVVGGTPHDLSIGFFVDGGGNDYYIVGEGWGGALTNSFGLFIDRLGDDLYATRGGVSFGNVQWARGFAGAAIFIDEEGKDTYPRDEPLARDSTIWTRSGWGIGIDLPRDVVATLQEEEVGEIILTSEDSAKSIEKLFEEASQWEVGSARKSVARARKALLTKGTDVVRYIINEKLNSRSPLEYRLFEQVVKAMPDSAGPLLNEKIPFAAEHKDDRYLINTVNLIGTIKWKPAVDALLDLLDKKSAETARNSIIYALGQIGDFQATKPIGRYITDPSERRRIAVINALGAIKDSASIPVVAKGLDDRQFIVRSAAMMTLPAFGLAAGEILLDIAKANDSDYPESAIYSLGKLALNLKDSADVRSGEFRFRALRLLQARMDDPNPFVRAEVVRALWRASGEAMRGWIEVKMEGEYDPVVKSAYREVTNSGEH